MVTANTWCFYLESFLLIFCVYGFFFLLQGIFENPESTENFDIIDFLKWDFSQT